MDVDAFRQSHRDHRVRGAFRLLGALTALALAFVQSLDGLISWHDAHYIVVPVPVVTGWLAGEVAVTLRRTWRARKPRIPPARIVPRRRPA